MTMSPEYAEARKSILPHLPADLILARYALAAGDEIRSGKLASKESSAALAANAFGFFLIPENVPYLSFPRSFLREGAATEIILEAQLRFPWTGGRHWLDAVVITDAEVIGIESKRYEPFRDRKEVSFSDAYDRRVWGPRMGSFEAMRDGLKRGKRTFSLLDAAQLVKHSFGLRTEADKLGKKARLVYLYAEPMAFPDGRPIADHMIDAHRREIKEFSSALSSSDDVAFVACSYDDLLSHWGTSSSVAMRKHAAALRRLGVERA